MVVSGSAYILFLPERRCGVFAKLALAGCLEAVVECDGDAPLREVEKVARRLEGAMAVRVARPERDPDEEIASPKAERYGLVERVRARLAGKGTAEEDV